MKTSIPTCLFGLITVSGVAIHADQAVAGHLKGAPVAAICSEGKTANGECVNPGLATRMRQAAGANG